MKIGIRTILLFSMMVLLAGCGKKEKISDDDISKINDFSNLVKGQAPNFVLSDLEGNLVEFQKEFEGKVVLLNFWATWCPPCREEMPDLVKLYNKHSSEGLVVVGISIDDLNREEISKFTDSYSIKFPILSNISSQESYTVGYAFADAANIRFTGVPTTYLIDRTGKIQKTYIGPRSEESFYNDIKPYL